MKKIEDNNTLVFVVDARTRSRSRMPSSACDIRCEKINTLIRPDGAKKARRARRRLRRPRRRQQDRHHLIGARS